MRNRYALIAILIVQAVSTVFFTARFAIYVLDLPIHPIAWDIIELIEVFAVIGLLLGVVSGMIALTLATRQARRAEQALRAASGAFMDHLHDRFDEWGLTPAERDVALFTVKGLSLAEIAALRGTSEGTVKAQNNAIYRKAGVAGRSQLLSLFIDDLVDTGA